MVTEVRPRVSRSRAAADPHLQGGVDGRRSPRRGRAGRGRRGARGPAPPAAAPPPTATRRAGRRACRGPSGRPSSQSARPSSVDRGEDVGRRWRRAGRSAALARSVASKRKPSCGTSTTRSRSEANGTSRRSTPSSRTAPSVGSISRVSSLASVVLPEPVSPTTATRVLGAIVQVDVVQHRAAARVGEADRRRSRSTPALAAAACRAARGRRRRRACRGCRSPGATRRWRSGRR